MDSPLLNEAGTHRRVVVVVLLKDTLDCLCDCGLVVCAIRRVSACASAARVNLTERDVGEKVVRDVVVSNLFFKASPVVSQRNKP